MSSQDNKLLKFVSTNGTSDSVYDLYRDVVDKDASAADFLNAMKGEQGKDGEPGPKGDKGDRGEAFTISKIYATLEDMNAGFATDEVELGQFIMISSITGGEYASQIYMKESTGYTYITDFIYIEGYSGGGSGEPGADGKSAYEIWLELGNEGTEQDFINSLKGEQGPKGDKGDTGETGPAGTDGVAGVDGKSAYQSWLDLGNEGTETDFINSLKGKDGENGADGQPGKDGITPHIGDNGNWFIGEEDTEISVQGVDGKSAYEIWLELGNEGTEADFIASLKGEKGDAGSGTGDGKSAYQSWLDLGNEGTEEDFIASLQGEDGADAKSAYDLWLELGYEGNGADFLAFLKGEDGKEGKDGRSITAITTDENNNVIVTFSDGEEQNIGQLEVDVQADFLTETGYGNLRFTDNALQYYDKNSTQWADLQVTSDNAVILNISPQPMQTFIAQCNPDTLNVELTIVESPDTILDGQVASTVEKVIIRRKLDGFPKDENDGELVLEIDRKNFGTYKNRPYKDIIEGIKTGDTYYYKAFPVNNMGIVGVSASNESQCTIKDYWLYGFKLDQDESDPSSMITYIADNENYKSAYMDYTEDAFNYGSWKSAWFMNVKPCILNYNGTVAYYLNPNDYTKKEDGTASDITDDNFAGNVMIEIPKTYWKIVDNGDNTANIYISNKKVDEDFVCWSHIDNNGNEIDYCYMPSYNGYSDNTRLRSLSGKIPSHTQTGTTEINLAKANNINDNVIWYTEVYSDRMLINLLLLLIGKSTDTQTIFGNGYCSGDSNTKINTGTMDNKGLFWGSNSSSMTGVKVFGMENWWGNQWRRIAGWINNKGIQMIKLTYGQSDGSTVDGYNTDGSGYINIGCTPSNTSGGCISKMEFTEYGLIPTTAKGSITSYYTDGLWFNNSEIDYAIVGGGSNNSFLVGAFDCSLANLISHSRWNFGSSISCKPLANTTEE